MTHARRVIPILAIVSLVAGVCASEPDGVDPVAPEPVTATLPPHEREPSVTELGEGDPDGEESGTALALDADYDQVRNGARLVLSYDRTARAFTGTVENATERTLRDVRVEVHLSPTAPNLVRRFRSTASPGRRSLSPWPATTPSLTVGPRIPRLGATNIETGRGVASARSTGSRRCH